MKKKKGRIGPGTVIASLIALCGAMLLYFGTIRVYNSYASLNWPKVEGKIIGSGISTYERHHGRWSYTPEVTYAYSFNSNSYVASQIRFVPLIRKKDEARIIADKYPRGKTVVVRCNPSNPGVAVLEPGAFPNTWVNAVLGAIILVSVVIVWRLYRAVKQKAAEDRALAKQKREKTGSQPQDQTSSLDDQTGAKSLPGKGYLSKIQGLFDQQIRSFVGDLAEKGFVSKIAGLIVVGIACWWWGFRHPSGDAGSETSPFQILFGALTGGWISAVFDVLWKILVIIAGITAVFLSRKVSTIPRITPIGDTATSTLAPEPRDVLERQLQTMGFHYLGDYEATMISSVRSQLRAYCDPDRQTAAALIDMTSERKTTTVLQFGTNLHPSGSIVTSTSQFPSIYARPTGKMLARVPWKNTAAEVFKLHQLLCQTARNEHFEAETVHASTLAENVRKAERIECEYQVKIGRLKRIAEDKYRMTLLGTIIAVPLVWWQMCYGSMFSGIKIPDSFFCWKLRRCLGRIQIRIQSEWARCEKSVDEIDI
ncbi:MAG: DUF3592 domain-containing protein, partial [Kiritimatiellae bacterium]|nr:DUF3592 domain-containing protein [Kiritimatiellia bacterium]